MKRFLATLVGGRKNGRKSRPADGPGRRSRPEVECLERREVPTITNQGGFVLPNVEVQALYYGSDWLWNAAYNSQSGYLDGFLNNIVNSSYMDMLTNAGYGVGRGSFNQGVIDNTFINKSFNIPDGQIEGAIVANINAGRLQVPDGNRLYVVFVEDNVGVTQGSGQTSESNFLGYHGAFSSWINPPGSPFGSYPGVIHYAVVTYPGGTVGNAGRSWLGALDTMTLTASHEIAEAVTDPNFNYGQLAWYDKTLNGENGDIANAQTVYLNGYAVQRIPDLNDQAMTPLGATSAGNYNFILKTDGTLYLKGMGLFAAPLTYLTSGIASVSGQGIDNFGQAMVDVVTTGGAALEYHVGRGWTYLTSGVTDAKAGQGVSYVLLNNGQAWEYKDWGQGAVSQGATWIQIDSGGVTAIDAGTDRYGVNMMTEVWYGYGYEWSDSTGWNYIDSGVQSISAGQNGILDYVTTSGNAYWFNQATGGKSFLNSGVEAVTAGTDQNGNWMIDLLFTNGILYEYRQQIGLTPAGWHYLDGGVTSIGKAHQGVIDMVFSWGDAYAYLNSSGWYYLTGGANTAA